MSILKHRILRCLREGPKTLHELCMCVNNVKNSKFCKRCIWLYRRGDMGKRGRSKAKLQDKGCQFTYLQVLRMVKELEEMGLIESKYVIMRDKLSTWKKDRFKLVSLKKKAT